jgi:hypothetical protein
MFVVGFFGGGGGCALPGWSQGLLQVRQCVVVGCVGMADTCRAHAFDARIPTGFNHANSARTVCLGVRGARGGVGWRGGGCLRASVCVCA